jgi:hypothetical protein
LHQRPQRSGVVHPSNQQLWQRARQTERGTDRDAAEDRAGQERAHEGEVRRRGGDDGRERGAELEPEAGAVHPAAVRREPPLIDLARETR